MTGASRAPSPPRTYADWSRWFDQFAQVDRDDDGALSAAANGHLIWSAGMAENFGARAVDALTTRLDQTGERLETHLRRMRSEAELLKALLDARRSFIAARRFADLVVFPASLREHLNALVSHHASERQKALERSAASDRSGRLAALLRNNPLDRAPSPILAPSPSPTTAATPAAVRRILLS